ncbi:hypothetical protein [Streptomyces tauricus]|uniref:hypothetical protein n=1 Tax=Streptomyces tauricus TaxID=68274 RepID=UPI00343D9DC8
MGFAVLLALLLIAGAVAARRRWGRARDLSDVSDLDAEADANRWVVRLGGSLSALDVRTPAGVDVGASAGVDVIAAQALTAAAERLRTARDELATARTAAQYALVTRTAVEGLAHVRTARTSLGLDQAEADGLMRIG